MMTVTKPATAELVTALNREQTNALVMHLNYKKYHWSTYGPHFRDIHHLFDEQATATFDMIDEFAERAYTIDGKSILDPADYLRYATVKPSSGHLSTRAMVAEAIAGLDTIVAEMHADAAAATNAGDIGTADLYTRLVQVHQKNRWFLREVLKSGDGF